jgi:hypothetical protein
MREPIIVNKFTIGEQRQHCFPCLIVGVCVNLRQQFAPQVRLIRDIHCISTIDPVMHDHG